MSRYIFFTKTDTENVKMHTINCESYKIAYKLLKEAGYEDYEITPAGMKKEEWSNVRYNVKRIWNNDTGNETR